MKVQWQVRETMNRRPRRNHSPAFKAKVALAAIKAELSEQQRYEALGDIIYFDEAAYYLNEDHWQMSRNRNLYMHHKQ